MFAEERPEDVHDIWAELDGQETQHQETHHAAGEDRQKEANEPHLRNCRSQHEQLEGRGRRKHRGKHQAPERMLVERLMNLFEALGRNALAQEFLAALVADDVNYDAAQCRPNRRHQGIQQESAPILVDVAGHDRVHGKAEEGAVDSGHHQHTPYAQRLQQRPQECCVAGKDVLDRLHDVRLKVYAKAKLPESELGRDAPISLSLPEGNFSNYFLGKFGSAFTSRICLV